MAKLTLSDITNLQNENSVVNTINNNNAATKTALENTLSRDGTAPNTMGAQLDMNSNAIINLPAASTATEPVRKAEYDAGAAAVGAIGATGLVTFNNSTHAFGAKTLTGTSAEVTVTNGDGSGTPTISIPTAVTFTGKTITGGTYVNPIFSGATITSLLLADNGFTLYDNVDNTKLAQFQLSGITTGTTRTFTLPDSNSTLLGSSNPTITGGSHTAMTGLGLRSTGAAFDLTLASSEVLTAGRTLSVIMGDAARSLTFTSNASIGGTHSGTSSGTNTGDQTITLTGDVTGTGTGSFATAIGATKITSGMLNTSAITGQTLNNSPVSANDYVMFYSASGVALNKCTISSLISAGTAGVTTFAGRSGSVVPVSGDYDGVAFGQTGLLLKGGSANTLNIKVNETLSGAKTLNLITGDTNRTVTLGGDITTAGALSHAGAFTQTFTATGNSSVTLPTSGTLLSTAAAVTVAQGGTGLATLTANNVILGNGTSNPTFVAPGSSGNVLTSNGTTWTSSASSGGTTFATIGSPVTLASDSTIAFTSLNVEDIIVVWNNVIVSATGLQLQMEVSTDGSTYTTTPIAISNASMLSTSAKYLSIPMSGLKVGFLNCSYVGLGSATAFGINNTNALTAASALPEFFAFNTNAPIVAIRFSLTSAGTFTSGTVTLKGR